MSDRSTQAVSQVLDNSSGLSNTVAWAARYPWLGVIGYYPYRCRFCDYRFYVRRARPGWAVSSVNPSGPIAASSPYTGDVQTLRCGYTDGLPNACTMSSEETTDIKHKDKLAIRRVY